MFTKFFTHLPVTVPERLGADAAEPQPHRGLRSIRLLLPRQGFAACLRRTRSLRAGVPKRGAGVSARAPVRVPSRSQQATAGPASVTADSSHCR